jgi:hypothetical protein
MSRLTELQRELQDASAAIVRAERTLAEHPDVPSVAATLRTIQKRKENLQEAVFGEANALGLDVCGYRIELGDGPAAISAITAVLGTFQKIFTTVYDAVVYGPKQTAKASAETIAATSFGFAYSFPGSLGIMMTLPNERLLIEETALDTAIKKTFELIEAQDADKVQELTVTVGLPAVRLAHQWATENAKAGFGANITWQRDLTVKETIRVQTQELGYLASLISGTTAKEEVVKVGELLDVDLITKKFQMRVGESLIRGDFDTAIGTAHPAQLPKLYKATLNVLQKVVISEGQEEITYFLLRLDEPDNAFALS